MVQDARASGSSCKRTSTRKHNFVARSWQRQTSKQPRLVSAGRQRNCCKNERRTSTASKNQQAVIYYCGGNKQGPAESFWNDFAPAKYERIASSYATGGGCKGHRASFKNAQGALSPHHSPFVITSQ